MTQKHSSSPQLIFDHGTAYDFFASLDVLNNPAKFGVRGAWAAGVRSRLPQEGRDFIDSVMSVLPAPYPWVYQLPNPKDATTALYSLKQIPPADRLIELMLPQIWRFPEPDRFLEVKQRGSWSEDDFDHLLSVYRSAGDQVWRATPRQLETLLNFFAESQSWGEQYLQVLQDYYDDFFNEEERRISSRLSEARQQAQEMAQEMDLMDLFEELSRGVRYEKLPQTEKIVMVPTYWLSPLVTYSGVDETCMLWLFGARPQGESLVPGEIVPDDLLSALKALADPTRLRILRYLMQEQLTPAELSRRLRLRAPTVTHHLHTLRLAGLVRFVLRGKHERLYFARLDSVQNSYALLKKFLEEDVGDELEELPDLSRRRTL